MTDRSPTAKARLAGGPIHAIAWNADCSAVAVSHGSSDVEIYDVSSSGGSGLSFAKTATLSGHGQFVSGLDWSTRGDQLLSCSHDRNAFVWTRAAASASRAASGAAASTSGGGGGGGGVGGGGGGGAWEKQMVITRLTKGALCVKWSPSEAKFAIGSAARNVCVGYYDPESKWWACKLIRKAHESSVVCMAWHPNSLLLATGSTDRRVRLFNAYVRGYEPEAPAGALPEGSSFGDCLFEVAHDGCGWVHSVAFAAAATSSTAASSSFPQLLYASHDFAVGAVDVAGGGAPAAAVAVRLPDSFLPLKCLAVVVPGRLAVGGGWSGGLAVLRNTGGGWQLAATLGVRDAAGGAGTAGGGAGAGAGGGGGAGGSAVARQIAALNLNAANMVPPSGTAASTAGGAAGGAGAGGGEQLGHGGALVTGLHVRPAAGWAAPGGPRWHVASCGLDGQVLLWDLSAFL